MIDLLKRPFPTRYPLWNSVILSGATTIVLIVFVSNEPLLIGMRIALVALWVAAAIIFAPDAWQAMWQERPSTGERLLLAIGTGAFSVIGLSQISILWRLSPGAAGQRWITDSDLTTVFLAAGILSGYLHCRSPESIQGSVPRRNTLIVGAMAGLAVFCTGVVLALQPHIGAHIDELRWLFPDVTRSIFGLLSAGRSLVG